MARMRALLLLERDVAPWGFVGVAAPDGFVRGSLMEWATAVQIAGELWAPLTAPADAGPHGSRAGLVRALTVLADTETTLRPLLIQS